MPAVRVMQCQFTQTEKNGRVYMDDIAASLDFRDGCATEGGIVPLLDYLGDGDRVYLFRFQIFYCIFEKWAIANAIPFLESSKGGLYTGHTKKRDYISALIIGTSPEIDKSKPPVCKKFRFGYKGKEITFIDIDQWIRDTPAFATPISYEYGQQCQQVIEFVIESMLPLTYQGEGKSSIASLARSLFNYPAKCTPIDESPLHKDRVRYLSLISPAYYGGVYFLSAYHAHEILRLAVCYDMRSAYPHQLFHKPLPNLNRPGEIVEGLEFDTPGFVHFYHVKRLDCRLKVDHFPSVFTQNNHSGFWGTTLKGGRGKKTPMHLDIKDGFQECIITSIDYKMLVRDYDIEEIEIDFSVRCSTVDGMTYFDRLGYFYELKEKEPKGSIARSVYKVLIDSFTGSLAMRTMIPQYVYTSLNKGAGVKREIPGSVSPVDVAAFMTAYQRWEITEYALRAGYDNVISIDTDSVFTIGKNDYLESVCREKGLGTMHIDKEMYWARWFGHKQYVGMVGKDYEIHITGLPACYWKEGVYEYKEKIPLLDREEKLYYIQDATFTLSKPKGKKLTKYKRKEKEIAASDSFIDGLLDPSKSN